jgi:repressor LexA
MCVSDKQKEMLAFIEHFVDKNGFPPTHEEIRVGLNISTKSLVNYHLEALEEAALLSRTPNTPRGIRLASDNPTVRVPLLTEAMSLSTPRANRGEQAVVELTYDIVPHARNLIALKARGDAWRDALVDDGDIVVIQRQSQVQNGELAAVRLIHLNQTTLKRFYRENGHVRLQPANPKLKPLIVKPDAIQIEGTVMAIIRQVS